MRMLRLADNVANARPQLRPLALSSTHLPPTPHQIPPIRRLWLGWCLLCFTLCSLQSAPPPSSTLIQPPHEHERGVSNNESRLAEVTPAHSGVGEWRPGECELSLRWHRWRVLFFCFFSQSAGDKSDYVLSAQLLSVYLRVVLMQSIEDSFAPVPQRRLARGWLWLLTGTSWHLVVANWNSAGALHLLWQTFCSSRCSSGLNLLCEMRHKLAISSRWNETTPCITCAFFYCFFWEWNRKEVRNLRDVYPIKELDGGGWQQT